MTKQETIELGEDLAMCYLQQLDYSILERNFECRQGEIDIVAIDQIEKELVFIEVKTKRNFLYGNPIDSIAKIKKKHMAKAVRHYLNTRDLENKVIRLDLIEIYLGKHRYKVNHIKEVI